MKLEIDLSDQAQLVKAREELRSLLEIVEFAMARRSRGPKPSPNQPSLEGIESSSETVVADPRIKEIINTLPYRFTTSDVLNALGDEPKPKRDLVKVTLRRMVDANQLIEVEKGRGRKPTTYEHVAILVPALSA